jgi:hypothetical protein
VFGTLAAALTSTACLATPVHGSTVNASPFTGRIYPAYDVVDGRFALHVGPLRDETTQTSQKILWVLAPKYRKQVGSRLVFTGRLDGVIRYRYTASGTTAYNNPSDTNYYFPTNLAPPTAGCWTFTLTTGRLKARLVAWVRPLGE